MKCNKCRVYIDAPTNICPLCNSEIKIKNKIDSSYPTLPTKANQKLLKKIIFFIACLVCITILCINYFLTPSIKWSIFVVLQIFLSYFVFTNIFNGRKKILKLLLTLNVLICSISIFWDFYSGFIGWSINYVFPALCISYGVFMLVLRFVNYFAFRETSSYIYLNICLGFIPIILVLCEKISANPLIYLSSLFAILNLLILIIFDGSNFKEDIAKRIHF